MLKSIMSGKSELTLTCIFSCPLSGYLIKRLQMFTKSIPLHFYFMKTAPFIKT